jgi:hypothetical protein
MRPTGNPDDDTTNKRQEANLDKPDRNPVAPPAQDLDRRIKRLEESIRAEENIIAGEDGTLEDELTRAVDRFNDKRRESGK